MNYRQLSEESAKRATECSQRGDIEGDFYARGLRGTCALVASAVHRILFRMLVWHGCPNRARRGFTDRGQALLLTRIEGR